MPFWFSRSDGDRKHIYYTLYIQDKYTITHNSTGPFLLPCTDILETRLSLDHSFPSLSTNDQERSLKGHMTVVGLSVSSPWVRPCCKHGALPAVLDRLRLEVIGLGMLTSPRTGGFGVRQSTSISVTSGWICGLSTPLGFLFISFS